MNRFRVTYEIVTPESAENGDSEEQGFVMAGGSHVDVVTVEDRKAVAMNLRSALRLMSCVEDSGSWFSESDGRDNYRTGANERRSLHPPRNITAASYRRIARLLGVK